jgi:hypothetical protein
MATQTLPELFATARQMLAGLLANAATVAARGLSADFTAQGQSLVDTA